MILSDRTIRRELEQGLIKPHPDDSQIQPASVDLKLGKELAWTNNTRLDLNSAGYALYPGKFVLGQTLEWIEIPTYLVGQLNGKSSLGRRGLMVHVTAGFIDPGFRGNITLELVNVGHSVIHLEEGMLIAQLTLIRLSTEVIRPYGHPELGSHYQDQSGATLSRE